MSTYAQSQRRQTTGGHPMSNLDPETRKAIRKAMADSKCPHCDNGAQYCLDRQIHHKWTPDMQSTLDLMIREGRIK